MLRALISPAEQTASGFRVVQIVDVQNAGDEFPIAPPLFWTDAPAGARAESHYYDPATRTVKPAPVVTPTPSPRDMDRADALAKLDAVAKGSANPADMKAMAAALQKII